MQHLTWRAVAERFLEFFRTRGHTVVPSSSLVPANDPTLLFTNAGMVQFKDVFLGLEHRPNPRAASLQKCMRVQGKHNDLENVGPSPRHQTFFLMLGNFSFGDYFKQEAITYAWDLITRDYSIAPDRLVITVFETDDESVAAWRRVGVPEHRIFRMGEKTNFWMMGEVGPCGPNSEIHYDWGPEHCTCHRPDCSVALDNECLRWLEIWNLVFMQYEQRADRSRVPLPSPGVDTGMGLERIASVVQGVNDDYGTDLFVPIMDRLQRLLQHSEAQREAHRVAYRVLADHGRAMTFLIGDGVVPGNEGRNYVLRMIMRRALRFSRTAGATKPVLAELANAVIAEMSPVYPELERQRAFILQVARSEEDRFAQTLANGLSRLEEMIAQVVQRGEQTLAGEEVFRLYDTFGFPIEMTRDVTRERGLTIDDPGFQRAMAAQRERARATQVFAASQGDRRYAEMVDEGLTSEFLGYMKFATRAKILALLVKGGRLEQAQQGTEVELVLDRTVFYPEAGGQVGDTGVIRTPSGVVEVRDTQRPTTGLILHLGQVSEGQIRIGQTVRVEVDRKRRWDIMRNHTATHLLHQALRETLGAHARQAGSLVAPERLRFDFVHLAPLTHAEREAIEDQVNEKILDDLHVRAQWMSYDEAIALGAVALFGEKYGDRVRVVSIDGYSRELCGGTHLTHTGQIGLFKITEEGGVGAGVRRLEAVTGRGAYALLRQEDTALRSLAELLRAQPPEVLDRVRTLVERVKALEHDAGAAHVGVSAQDLEAVIARAREVDGIKVLTGRFDGLTHDALRMVGDRLRDRTNRTVVLLGSVLEDRVNLVAMITKDVTGRVHAGEFVKDLAAIVGGTGGGRPEVAQAGGKDPGKLDEALAQAPQLLQMYLERTS